MKGLVDSSRYKASLAQGLLLLLTIAGATVGFWGDAWAQNLTFKQVVDLKEVGVNLGGAEPLGIGIGYDPFKDRLIVSVGFPIGKLVIVKRNPHNTIVGEPIEIEFQATSGVEGKIAVAPLEAKAAGFNPGDIFAARPVADDPATPENEARADIFKINPEAKSAELFVTLPHFASAGIRGIEFDQIGTWGNAVLVTDTDGFVYKISSSGGVQVLFELKKMQAVLDLLGITDLNKQFLLLSEGITVAPLGFGTVGGYLIIGANCTVIAIAPNGTVTKVVSEFPADDLGVCVEDVDFVPEDQNLFVTTDSSGAPNETDRHDLIAVAEFKQFEDQKLVGHLMVTIERPHQVWDVFFDGQQFVKRKLAGLTNEEVAQGLVQDPESKLLLHGEHVSFGKVLNDPPKVPPFPEIFQEQQCSSISFDASGSTDPDNDPLTFKWELIQAPTGTVPRILSTSSKFSFSPTAAGLYRLRLTVSDSRGGTSTVETSINVFPSLGCGFTPGKTDFDIDLNSLIHQIYEIIVDVTNARRLISQKRPVSLIEDAIDRALQVLEGVNSDFAELFGLLDNLDETLTDFIATVLAELEGSDITPTQAALIAKVKAKLEVIQTTLLELRNELESLRDTLDTGDPDANDVRSALEAAHEAVNNDDLVAARAALNTAYLRLRTARREQGRILAKQRVIMKRFVEISPILPRVFGALNSNISVTPATPAAQAIQLKTESAVSLWVVPQQDGSFVFRAENADVKTMQIEVFKLNGERVTQRTVLGPLVSFKPTDTQGRSLANGVYLVVIHVKGESQATLLQHIHKLTILQK